MCNMEWFNKLGLEPPAVGLSKWRSPRRSKKPEPDGRGLEQEGIWCLGLQLLPSFLQDLGEQLDTSSDGFVSGEEALEAFRAGIIGAVARHQRAWLEQKRAGFLLGRRLVYRPTWK